MKDNQTTKILNHLKKYGSVSTYDSFLRYGCTRLSARIFDLRKQGFNITTHYTTKKGITYANYILEDKRRANVD